MLSASEVSTLLDRHQAEIDYQARVAPWSKRLTGFKAGIISLGGAAALALATYLFFFVGAPQTTHLQPGISSHPPLATNEARSYSTEPALPTVEKIGHTFSLKDKETGLSIANGNTSGSSAATSHDMDVPFCLSALPYRVDTASISMLVPRRLAIVANPAVRTIPEDRRRVTYQHESDANNDLLGSIYDIGYQTFANPVISAYDTVRSVSERTLATLDIVPHR